MKKIISVLLAVLMIFSSMAMLASATEITDDESTAVDRFGVCTCADHKDDIECCCCIHCETTNDNFRTSCAIPQYDANGNKYYKVCCKDCVGVYPCDCGCVCCSDRNEDIGNKNDSNVGDYITDADKENFVDGFQAILKRISDFFDMLFNTIFEFLRIDEVLGGNSNA